MCVLGLQCGLAGQCVEGPATVGCDLRCGEWFLGGLMGFKGQFEVTDAGKRIIETFPPDVEAKIDGCISFGGCVWIRPHGASNAFEVFGAKPFDLITRINDIPATDMRMRILMDCLEQGIETRGSIMFIHPSTGEHWKAEYRIVKKPPAVEMPVEAASHSLDQAK